MNDKNDGRKVIGSWIIFIIVHKITRKTRQPHSQENQTKPLVESLAAQMIRVC